MLSEKNNFDIDEQNRHVTSKEVALWQYSLVIKLAHQSFFLTSVITISADFISCVSRQSSVQSKTSEFGDFWLTGKMNDFRRNWGYFQYCYFLRRVVVILRLSMRSLLELLYHNSYAKRLRGVGRFSPGEPTLYRARARRGLPSSAGSPTLPVSDPVYCEPPWDPVPDTKPVSVRAWAFSRNSSLCVSIWNTQQ